MIVNKSMGNFFPAPGRLTENFKMGTTAVPAIDSIGNLSIRGAVTTDEGSVRDDFSGANIYNSMTGTISFLNGSTRVLGYGTTFSDGKIAYGDYVRLSTDADSCFAKVQSIISDGELQLVSAYTGATGSGTGHSTKFKPIIGSGGSLSVATSNVTINSGTTINARTSISREIDYCPLVFRTHASISQRIANQTAYIGLADDPVNPTRCAWFMIDGTTNTTIKTQTMSGSSANDAETSGAITLPNSANTGGVNRYRILLNPESCKFYVNEILIAEHFTHLPDQYSTMDGFVGFVNGGSAPASTTAIVCDVVYAGNFDQLQTTAEPSTIPINFNSTQINGYAVATGGQNGQQQMNVACSYSSSGGSNHTLISLATTNATSVKSSNGRIYSCILTNTTASFKYFKIYSKASAPTVGTDTPNATIGIPPNSTIQALPNDIGMYLGVGIAYAITGASALVDTTAVALGDVLVNIIYY